MPTRPTRLHPARTGLGGLLAASMLLGGCGDPTGPTTPIEGERLFEQHCARCHGLDGSGVPEQPAAVGRLSNPALMREKSDDEIMGVIRHGKPPNMPGFAEEFTDVKIMVLTAYVRQLSAPRAEPAREP